MFIEASPDERTGTFESITLSAEDSALAARSLRRRNRTRSSRRRRCRRRRVPAPADHEVMFDVQIMRDALAEPDHERPVTPSPAPPEPAAVVPAEDEIPFMSKWSAATVEPRR